MRRTALRGLLVLVAILTASCTDRSTSTAPSVRAPSLPSADGVGDTVCRSGYPVSNGAYC